MREAAMLVDFEHEAIAVATGDSSILNVNYAIGKELGGHVRASHTGVGT
jgi:hypothetical protein